MVEFNNECIDSKNKYSDNNTLVFKPDSTINNMGFSLHQSLMSKNNNNILDRQVIEYEGYHR